MRALATAIRTSLLPARPFHLLVQANRQDQTVTQQYVTERSTMKKRGTKSAVDEVERIMIGEL